MNSLYERYHSKRSEQKRTIGDDNFTYRELLSLLQKHSLDTKKILDIGCGVGTIDFYLVKKGADVLGIDISQNAILIARKNAQNFSLNKKARFEAVNFPESVPKGKFDIIVCSEVLEHLKQDKTAITKIKNLLQNGGMVIASSPSLNAPLYKMGLLKGFDWEVGHLRRYTLESFVKLFESSGFKVLETKKTEGVLRNFLFTNSFGGFLLRILNKWPFSKVVTFVDNFSIPIFGESNFYLVAQKK